MKPNAAEGDAVLLANSVPIRRIGFGAMRITGRGVWGPPADSNAAINLLRHAVDLGVNFIDTADSYGPAISEELIEAALRPYSSNIIIGTKGGMTRAGPWKWEINGRPDHLRACVEESLRRLKTETIDLYQFHRPDPKVPVEESLGALAEMQNAGKIRFIGVCNVDSAMLDRCYKATTIVSVQNHYNLISRTDHLVLEACATRRLVFFSYFPLGDAGDGCAPKLVSADPEHPLATIAAKLGATIAQVALAWIVKTLPFAVPIPGTGSLQHLKENFGAIEVAARLTQDDLQCLSMVPTSAASY